MSNDKVVRAPSAFNQEQSQNFGPSGAPFHYLQSYRRQHPAPVVDQTSQ